MRLPKVKVPRVRTPRVEMSAPRRPRLDNGDEAEVLSGEVQGMKASALEERFARALDKERISYQFRYTIGAPRGLPGWKELDYLIERNGQIYAVEVDSAFTHRNKGESDRLHDAIVLSELEQEGFQAFPQVIHLQGETDLINQRQADATANKLFS